MVLNRVVRFDTLSHIAKRPVYVSLEILTGLVAGRELVAPCFSPLSVRVSNFDPEQTCKTSQTSETSQSQTSQTSRGLGSGECVHKIVLSYLEFR